MPHRISGPDDGLLGGWICGSSNVPVEGALALVELDGTGACMWNKLFALSTAKVTYDEFTLGADGTLALIVVYTGAIDFGAGPVPSAAAGSLVIARFDAAGSLLWTRSFDAPGLTPRPVRINTAGSMLLVSGYSGAVDLGSGPLPASADTVIAVFDAGGQLVWDRAVKVGSMRSLRATLGSCGVFVATDSSSVDVGTGPLTPDATNIGVAALGL